MRLNVRPVLPHGITHEGAAAAPMTPEQALRRSVMSCMLWEREFYEDGEEIAARIVRLVGEVTPTTAASVATEARSAANLRHVPLLIAAALAKHRRSADLVEDVVFNVVQRADELAELLVIHAKINGVDPSKVKKHIPAAMKRGLARAVAKFDEYQLAKHDRPGAVRLRDVLRLVHPKPKDADQSDLWKRLVAGDLATPDTWEVQLSGGADKRETFERLLREGRLGYLALLRNLRNMADAGCDPALVRDAIIARKGARRVLPFRYVAAARAAPQFEPAIDQSLCEAISEVPALPGKTVVLVDVSGSMSAKLSSKSDLTRMDAAAALGAIVHGDIRLFTFSNALVEVPPRRGTAGVDAIVRSQPHMGTNLFGAIKALDVPYDRLIVITDEQANAEPVSRPTSIGYLINVASAERGVGYGGNWVHIDGFSESVLRFINEHESAR